MVSEKEPVKKSLAHLLSVEKEQLESMKSAWEVYQLQEHKKLEITKSFIAVVGILVPLIIGVIGHLTTIHQYQKQQEWNQEQKDRETLEKLAKALSDDTQIMEQVIAIHGLESFGDRGIPYLVSSFLDDPGHEQSILDTLKRLSVKDHHIVLYHIFAPAQYAIGDLEEGQVETYVDLLEYVFDLESIDLTEHERNRYKDKIQLLIDAMRDHESEDFVKKQKTRLEQLIGNLREGK